MDSNEIKNTLAAELATVKTLEALEDLRVKYLGRKGFLAELTAKIPSLPKEERAAFGKEVNSLKSALAASFDEKQQALGQGSATTAAPAFDMGLPGIAPELGTEHPLSQMIGQICGIFSGMGFHIIEGPEIETEENNFTGLNIPLNHPSRDAFDTFYLRGLYGAGAESSPEGERLLLRSHTSPVQVRIMKSHTPPLAVVVPGRVYRPDAVDASHLFMFHQIEGVMVNKDVRFSDLKGILELFVKNVFGSDIKMRLRPHFFPFTEPSAEVDISCIICKGKGCSVCGRKGWLEILGCGMIHPNVFKHVGYPSGAYTGFAFGMGVERIAMLKYGINDIRLFVENDVRFLNQF